jgi:hypothetical protein
LAPGERERGARTRRHDVDYFVAHNFDHVVALAKMGPGPEHFAQVLAEEAPWDEVVLGVREPPSAEPPGEVARVVFKRAHRPCRDVEQVTSMISRERHATARLARALEDEQAGGRPGTVQ